MPYRSDLSDAEWAVIEPELMAWREPRLARKVSSNQPLHDLREIVNAVLYVNRTGCAWEYLPHDFPPFMWNQLCQVAALGAWRVGRRFASLKYLVRPAHLATSEDVLGGWLVDGRTAAVRRLNVVFSW